MNRNIGRQAQATLILSLALLLLAFGAGCTDAPETNATENVTPAPVFIYERGNVSIPINTSEIPVRSFDANTTEVIEILLADQRAGVLLENGWKIASVRTGFAKLRSVDPARTYVDVEFRRDEPSPSFFIEVDEQRRAGRGYCNVPEWEGGPEDYHQNWTYQFSAFSVFDHHNERLLMVYNETAIFYLYPSYGKEWLQAVEG
ncbi:hypothetical protein [Methanoculleus sp. 7T]|uniref:hypothetical protein n=1 Tax=Methanoculleus sp. 7T TaxID=2937282 RepID=UPI0020BEEC5A|nr:hypothetical protein [Methanoculleus sp. 7T]MCK8518665.1 hypothetical protein [Methanoculleus sp. 7T]